MDLKCLLLKVWSLAGSAILVQETFGGGAWWEEVGHWECVLEE